MGTRRSPPSATKPKANRAGLGAFIAIVIFVMGFTIAPIVCAITSSPPTSTPVSSAPPPSAPPAPPGETACPASFAGLRLDDTGRGTCWCHRGIIGSVWGVAQYTADSSPCAAAQHAGAVPPSGARVSFLRSPGCSSYAGTFANGVTTRSWQSYGSSFVIEGRATPGCSQQFVTGTGTPPPVAPEATVVASAGTTVQTTGGVSVTFSTGDGTTTYTGENAGRVLAGLPPIDAAPAGPPPCPGHLPVPSSAAPTLTRCTCTTPIESAPVWGDRRYAIDSGVCAAALHAEAIPPTGGPVALWTLPGCSRYLGARRGGVTSRAGEATDASFTFDVGVESAGLAGAPPCP